MLSERPSEGKKTNKQTNKNFPEFILDFDVQRLPIYQKKMERSNLHLNSLKLVLSSIPLF